ncbi:hypothetical protein [Niallia nealsonii]|uniref:hypothetical protein n=1 Tax=Niallia nealsonii TaxID=115979 RepID=UPI000C31C2DB|nr:hypothetical protein [Niallia nealsonii]
MFGKHVSPLSIYLSLFKEWKFRILGWIERKLIGADRRDSYRISETVRDPARRSRSALAPWKANSYSGNQHPDLKEK